MTHYKQQKVPPAINQFSEALDCQTATQWLKVTHSVRQRQAGEEAKAASQCWEKSRWQRRPPTLLVGTNKVENRKALLLVIAHNVDAIELVAFLPALCHKVGGGGVCVLQHHQREGQAGVAGPQEDRNHCSLHTDELIRQKALWLSSWKLSGPITMTDTRRSATTTGVTVFSVQNLRFTFSSRESKGQRTRHWTRLIVYC